MSVGVFAVWNKCKRQAYHIADQERNWPNATKYSLLATSVLHSCLKLPDPWTITSPGLFHFQKINAANK